MGYCSSRRFECTHFEAFSARGFASHVLNVSVQCNLDENPAATRTPHPRDIVYTLTSALFVQVSQLACDCVYVVLIPHAIASNIATSGTSRWRVHARTSAPLRRWALLICRSKPHDPMNTIWMQYTTILTTNTQKNKKTRYMALHKSIDLLRSINPGYIDYSRLRLVLIYQCSILMY